MDGRIRAGHHRAIILGLTAAALVGLLPGASSAAAERALAPLPDCAEGPPPGAQEVVVSAPWHPVLDADGVVTEHRLTLRRAGAAVTLQAGQRGFAIEADDGRLVVGDRGDDGTTLVMVDLRRGCRVWARTLPSAAYEAGSGEAGGLLLDLHDPGTRAYQGRVLLDAESGATIAMIDGQCSTTCDPSDGDLVPADFLPAGAPRPVPAFPAGGWPKDTLLPFAWQAGALPPEWARSPMTTGASDASDTSSARSPRFVYRSSASDTMRYTPAFPTFCRFGIACAQRNMPVSWVVWLRPHGTDFGWGTLRWCQKDDVAGCFDVRRVLIHELGHVAGLDHPSREGFALAAHETVMHAITPAKPAAGSGRHAFGRCDVATLQELYDVPASTTLISSCNDVPTTLVLTASSDLVPRGTTVQLRAELRVASEASVGRLAGNLLGGRSLKLRYRRAGSADPWTTLWMAPSGAAYSLAIAPQASWEFQAVFAATADEGLRGATSGLVKVRVSR